MGVIFASLAASLDGYIRSASGDMAWLNDSMRRDEDYGMAETMARAGAYLMGATTYRESASMFGGNTPGLSTHVVTHDPPAAAPPGVSFHAGDLGELSATVRAETDKDVYVFGGGDILTQTVAANALDELTIALIPVVLGSGTRLFGDVGRETYLHLTHCQSFASGIVLLKYERA